jgi:hypothetical protein
MGTVTTLAAGSDATATITGTDAAPVLNLGIPKGDQGDQGEQGPPGADGQDGASITVSSNVIEYQEGTSGTTAPVGTWSQSVPTVTAGNYLWTRVTTTFSDGAQAVSYSVSRMGIDGSGSVVSVCNVSPDGNGNVALTASDVGAKPASYSAPVDSVNGQTGAVVLTAADVGAKPSTYSAPVDSVNTKTGAVVLTASDVNALPDTYTPPVTSVNNKTGDVALSNQDLKAPYGLSKSKQLTASGWYRVLKYEAGNLAEATGAVGFVVDLSIGKDGVSSEAHKVTLFGVYGKVNFIDESSVSQAQHVDKVRYTYQTSSPYNAYVDIHLSSNPQSVISVDAVVKTKPAYQSLFSVVDFTAIADAPSGETIVTEYTLSATKARGKYTLWSGYTQTDVALSDNMYNYDELLLTAVTNVDCYCFAISPSAFLGNNWVCSASAGPVEGGYSYNSSLGVAPANSGNGLAISVSSNNPNWTLHLLKVEGIIA